jgi:hypothetical protein
LSHLLPYITCWHCIRVAPCCPERLTCAARPARERPPTGTCGDAHESGRAGPAPPPAQNVLQRHRNTVLDGQLCSCIKCEGNSGGGRRPAQAAPRLPAAPPTCQQRLECICRLHCFAILRKCAMAACSSIGRGGQGGSFITRPRKQQLQQVRQHVEGPAGGATQLELRAGLLPHLAVEASQPPVARRPCRQPAVRAHQHQHLGCGGGRAGVLGSDQRGCSTLISESSQVSSNGTPVRRHAVKKHRESE